jgi:hypothetical protein
VVFCIFIIKIVMFNVKEFDVAAFLYDSTDPGLLILLLLFLLFLLYYYSGSFEYSAKLQSKLVDPYIPCIFIETKVDRPRVPQVKFKTYVTIWIFFTNQRIHLCFSSVIYNHSNIANCCVFLHLAFFLCTLKI